MKARVERWEGERVKEKLPRFLSSHHPWRAHCFFKIIIFIFYFLLFLNAPIFIGIPSGTLCEGRPHYSARAAPRIRPANALTEKPWENAVQ